MAKPRKNEGPIEAAMRAQGFVLLREACEGTGLIPSTVLGHIEAKRIKAEVLNGCNWVKPEDVRALVPVVEENKRKTQKIFSPGGGQNALQELRGVKDGSQPDPLIQDIVEMAVRRVLAEQAQLIKELVREAVKEALS